MDPSQMMSRSFPMWPPPPVPPSDDLAAPPPPPPQPFLPPPNRGWKRKNPPSSAGGYQPPALGDLQVQNRAKARRWFKNHNSGANRAPNRRHFKAAAPRNTTSYIIRAKRAGGIASLVSPCPVTPAVLPTPRLSPSREGLADMAQAQWGVDGYGSMKGLIRLRSSPHPTNQSDEDDDSSGSDVEEHVEVERRLDHDLSRFEMVYPAAGEDAGGYLFEDDDDYDQDAHVARLEEENLTLKERLFLMEQEVGDMRRRLEALEARFSQTDGFGGGCENDGNTLVGSENSSEDNVERVTDIGSEKRNIAEKGAVNLKKEHIAGKGFVNSEKELLAEKAAADSEKSDKHNEQKMAVDSENGVERDDSEKVAVDSELIAEKAAADSEKSNKHNAEKVSVDSDDPEKVAVESELVAEKAAADSEKSDKHNAENVAVDSENRVEHDDSEKVAVDSELVAEKAAADSEKSDKHNAEKVAVDSENGVEHDGSEKVAVDSENSGDHDAEMIDAVLEKTDVDDGGRSGLELSTRD